MRVVCGGALQQGSSRSRTSPQTGRTSPYTAIAISWQSSLPQLPSTPPLLHCSTAPPSTAPPSTAPLDPTAPITVGPHIYRPQFSRQTPPLRKSLNLQAPPGRPPSYPQQQPMPLRPHVLMSSIWNASSAAKLGSPGRVSRVSRDMMIRVSRVTMIRMSRRH